MFIYLLLNLSESVGFTFRAAICCVGTMYEKLGRMMGRSYEETVQILIRSLRSAESQTRIEIMLTLEKVLILIQLVYKVYWIYISGVCWNGKRNFQCT